MPIFAVDVFNRSCIAYASESDINKSSIYNLQFPDKTGFRLRWNPASGISAALRPAKLVRVMAGCNI
jgi:hypothetical protein